MDQLKSTDLLHLYDERYFRNNVDGDDLFTRFDGRPETLSPLYQGFYHSIDPKPGKKILDLGCGRGELCIAMARAGAEVIGIDFAEAAIKFGQEKAQEVAKMDQSILARLEFRRGDIKRLADPDQTFDCIVMTEVAEHVSTSELIKTLREAHRVLKPGGKLLVYSYPNRWQRRIGYPLLRLASKLTKGVALPKRQSDQMDDHYYQVHINEMSPVYLWRILRRCGFTPAIRVGIVDPSPLLNVWGRLNNAWLIRLFFSHNLYAEATKRS